jgi:hypothetical protein
VIESFVEGRIRLRSPILADQGVARLLVAGILKIDGVLKAEANSRTSGLLLEYDKTRLPLSLLMGAQNIFTRMGEVEKLPQGERCAAIEGLLEELSGVLNSPRP